MRVIVTGSRDYWDRHAVWDALDEIQEKHWEQAWGSIQVVHGGCPTGADEAADDWCRFRKVTPEVFRAKWDLYGKRAGPIRNEQMVKAGADVVLAFIRNGSKGASHTVQLAHEAGITVQTEVINDERR